MKQAAHTVGEAAPAMTYTVTPIGLIHSPLKKREDAPIQPVYGVGHTATIEIYPEYHDGLKDLAGFSHIIVLYWFHRSSGYRLQCRPFLDAVERGVFATRAPRRPNPIGLSVVECRAVEGGQVTIRGVDMVDGTPVLDIKPYIAPFDSRSDVAMGWFEQAADRSRIRADDRFSSEE